jgi:hypothetical protein
MCTQSSSGGERRGKDLEQSRACSIDIKIEDMTMEEAMMEKLTVNNLPKWGLNYSYRLHVFMKTAE